MSAFTLSGELVVGTTSFARSMRESDAQLDRTEKKIADTERAAKRLGQTNATTARSYDKLKQSVSSQRDQIRQATAAYSQGAITQTKFQSILRGSEQRIAGVNARLGDMKARLSDMPSRVDQLGAGLMAVSRWGALAAGALGVFAVKSAVTFDSAKRGLISVAGSSEEAEKQLVRLREVAKLPGLGFIEAVQGSVNLQAAGLSAQTAERALQAFGNALAIVGKGKADLDGVSLALTQIANKSRVSAQEINQLAERVPQIRQAMKDAFGTADTEELEKKGIKPKEFIEGIIKALEKLPQATMSAQGSFENFGDAVQKAIQPIGQRILDAVLPSINIISEELSKDNPDYAAAGDKIGNQIGKAIGVGIGQGIPNLAEIITKRIASDLKGETIPITLAPTISIGKGIFAGLGIESLQEGLQAATQAVWTFFEKTTLAAAKWATAFPRQIGEVFGHIIGVIHSFVGPAYFAGSTVGANAGQGFIDGLKSKAEAIGNMAAWVMGQMPIGRVMGALKEHSPSKVFFQIGKDVVQGFIDGIAAMKASTQAALADLLDLSKITGKLGKGDKAGVQYLTQLNNELARLGVETKKQEKDIEMSAVKYKNLNADVRARIDLAAVEIDKYKATADLTELYNDLLDEATGKTEYDIKVRQIHEAAIAGVNKRLVEQTGILHRLAGLKDILETSTKLAAPVDLSERETTGTLGMSEEAWDAQIQKADEMMISLTPPAPLIDHWQNFWAMMQSEMSRIRESSMSVKQALGENLMDAFQNVGYILTDAIENWDGTLQGFFKNIAKGFAKMAQQIISEMIRIMVMQMVLKLIGAFAGAAGGGTASGADFASVGDYGAAWAGGGWSLAKGGHVRGGGSSTSDSIAARLSDGEFVMSAKSVKKWGVGFFERLNSATMPLAFAGGGYVGSTPAMGGGSTITNNSPINVNMIINTPNANSFNRSQSQITREMANALKMQMYKGEG